MSQKLFAVFLCSYLWSVNSLQLKKVVIFGRHGVRSPYTRILNQYSSNPWPKWSVEPGYLTPKGSQVESLMGEYFLAWIEENGLICNCADENSVYVFANSVQRSIETANAFVEAAFRDCNVSVHFNKESYPKFDIIFSNLIGNDTEAFKLEGEREMKEKLSKIDLNEAYAILNDVVDIRNSHVCKHEGFCDFTEGDDKIEFNFGALPSFSGRFRFALTVFDVLLMSYYEGFPENEVAWGKIRDDYQWKILTEIMNEARNLCFNLSITRDCVMPLVKLLKGAIEDERKFTMFVGHDSNFQSMIPLFGFELFELPEQYEFSPIGGKLVFQKWSDGVKDFMKIEYVYQSRTQIRGAEKLSLQNPPKNVTMRLKSCIVNENGMCPWTDFEKLLNNIIL